MHRQRAIINHSIIEHVDPPHLYKSLPLLFLLCHFSSLLSLPSATGTKDKHTKKTLELFSQPCFQLLTFLLITMIMAFGAPDPALSCSSYGAYTVLAWPSTEVGHAASDNQAFPLTFDFSYLEPHSQVPWPKACRLVHSAFSRRLCPPLDVVFNFAARYS